MMRSFKSGKSNERRSGRKPIRSTLYERLKSSAKLVYDRNSHSQKHGQPRVVTHNIIRNKPVSEDSKKSLTECDTNDPSKGGTKTISRCEHSVESDLEYSAFTRISHTEEIEGNTISDGHTMNTSEQDVDVILGSSESGGKDQTSSPELCNHQDVDRNSSSAGLFHNARNHIRADSKTVRKGSTSRRFKETPSSTNRLREDPHSKGDRLSTPPDHLRPWPPATQFQQRPNEFHRNTSESVPTELLLKKHNDNLLASLKDATVQLAKKDMEMQRLISVNSQLGERYCRMRGQYLELAREQARLRQRYDMLLVKGMDREQLRESNNELEDQMEQLRTRLLEAEERANQYGRRLARCKSEAKEAAQMASATEARLTQLQAELDAKEAQLNAQSCRKIVQAARELQARAILNELLELKGNVRVMIRCYSDSDKDSIFRVLNEDTLVLKPFLNAAGCHSYTNRKGAQAYQVYRVFPSGTPQRAVFDEVSQLVLSCIDGYSASILAYGQAGSGKTFTMLGAPSKPGIIPRVARHLLAECQNRAPLWSYRISVTMLQVHKEVITDLLADSSSTSQRISLHDNGKQLLLKGVREVEVTTESELLEELRKARTRRQALATSLHIPTTYLHFVMLLRVRGICSGALVGKERQLAHSPRPISAVSRSTRGQFDEDALCGNDEGAETKDPVTRMATHGLLILADLAGFDNWQSGQMPPTTDVTPSRQSLMTIDTRERETKTRNLMRSNAGRDSVEGEVESKETKYLGKSLITLGRVLDAMANSDGTAKHHIPFRDSKLTHLLKPALCGDARCMLIVTLNTHFSCFEASVRSLKLAARASKINLGRTKRNSAVNGGIRTKVNN